MLLRFLSFCYQEWTAAYYRWLRLKKTPQSRDSNHHERENAALSIISQVDRKVELIDSLLYGYDYPMIGDGIGSASVHTFQNHMNRITGFCILRNRQFCRFAGVS